MKGYIIHPLLYLLFIVEAGSWLHKGWRLASTLVHFLPFLSWWLGFPILLYLFEIDFHTYNAIWPSHGKADIGSFLLPCVSCFCECTRGE